MQVVIINSLKTQHRGKWSYQDTIHNCTPTPKNYLLLLLFNMVRMYMMIITIRLKPLQSDIYIYMLSSQISVQWNLVKSRYLQHGGCWWPGACLVPGHRQQPWWQIPSCKWLIVVIIIRRMSCFRNKPKLFVRYLLSLRLNFVAIW